METRKSYTRDEKLARQVDAVAELKHQQLMGTQEMTEANIDPSVIIPAIEADKYVHVRLTTKNHDPLRKTYHEASSIVPIHANEFDRRVAEGAFNTYDKIEVVNDRRANRPEVYGNLKPGVLDSAEASETEKIAKAVGDAKLRKKEELDAITAESKAAKAELDEANDELKEAKAELARIKAEAAAVAAASKTAGTGAQK